MGTARVREQIADAARELADSTPVPLDKPMRTLAAGLMTLDEAFGAPPGTVARIDAIRAKELAAFAPSVALSPIERMQQLGRMPCGAMNKTEAAYAQLLDARLAAGEILWYRFEGIKLRLAARTFITIDFAVIPRGAPLEFHEVKGRWTDDARAKTKVAAEQFPFRFIAIQRDGRHGWRTEDLTSRSW
ncbi:hypothetical protein AB3X91_11845 [Paraburkholderia sp. BR14263]|uniref:hypothetical protein n=1 Tax=unclassified Paraburkholderia TaxID=2615204 RepID=UPI0034CF3BC7